MHKDNSQYISLKQASNFSDYSQDYLSLRARQGKLKAVKLGRNWVTKKEWLEEYTDKAEEYKEEHNGNGKNNNNGTQINSTEEHSRDFTYKRPVLSHAIIAVAILVFILFSGGVAFGYHSNSILKPLSSVVGSVITSIDLGVNETVKDISESKVFEYTSKSTKYAFEYVDEYIEYLLKTESSQYVIKNIKDVSEKIIRGKDIIFNEISETKFARYVKGVFEYVNEEAIVFINIISKKVWDNNLFANIEIPDYIKSSISDNIRNFKKFTGEITSKLFSPIKRGYEFVIRPWKIIPSSQFEISRQEFEKGDTKEINNIKAELEKLKEEGVVAKEIIKEVSKITQIEPIKEITKEIIKIDDEELEKLKSQIAGIQKWEGDIRNLQILTSKLRTNPPYTQITTAPVYIASQGLQVDGVGVFSSLGVSGSAGITNLGVGDSTSLGSDSSDRLTVNATSEFLSPVAIENTFTVGDTTNYLTIDSTGNLTTTGNLTVQGTQTGTGIVSYTASSTNPVLVVNQTGSGPIVRFQDSGNTVFQITEKGALTLTSTSTPQFKIAYDNSNYLTGSVSSAGDSTIASTGGLNLTGNATSTWQVVGAKLTIQTATSGDILLASAEDLTLQFATTSAFTLYHGETARLAIDSSGNISATGTTISLVGDTTITGSATTTGNMVIQATTTLATTTITRLGIGTITPSQLFHVSGAGNILFENTGTVSITPTATTSFGASTSTPIIFTGYISSNIYPYTDNNYDLGSSSYRWQDIYAVAGHFGGTIDITTDKIDATSALTIESGDTLTVTSTNAFALGVAGVQRFSIATSGNIVLTGGITFSGSATTTGNLVVQSTSTLATTTVIGDLAVNTDQLYVDKETGYVGIGTSTPTQLFSVAGSTYITGGLGIGVATTTAGVIQTSGNVEVGGNLKVLGSATTIGGSVSDTLTINSTINSDLIPDKNITRSLGSSDYYWGDLFVGNVMANNLSAASTTIGGTKSESFTINSDNSTSDTEDMDLIFFRGTVVPNALLKWDSTLDKFDINQPVFVQNDSSTTTVISFDIWGRAGQTADLFRVASSSGDSYLNITSAGYVGIGTSTPSQMLTIGDDNQFTVTSAGVVDLTSITFNNVTDTIAGIQNQNLLDKTDAETITGIWDFSTTTHATATIAYADINKGTVDSISSLTASGNLDIGAHGFRAQSLTADGLTSGRVIFAGIDGLLSDDSDMTFSGETLTVTQTSVTTSTITYLDVSGGLATFSGVTTTDFYCSDCLNETEIEDIYLLFAGDEMTGNLTFDAGTVTIAGIQNQNLLDKTASETISGEYTFTATSTLATTTITKLTVNWATALDGGLTMDTNKFTVADATGNTLIAGTLDVTGNFNVNTDKFQVTAASGNTAIAGTLGVTGTSTLATTSATKLTISNLTSGRIPIVGTGGLLRDDSDFTFSGETLTVTQISVATTTHTANLVMGDNSITGIDTLVFTDVNGAIAGIQNQNLVDKTAIETITGGWTFSTATTTFSKDIQLGSVPIYFANGTTYYINSSGQANLATTTISNALTIGSSQALSDVSGTLTLSNVDAIDATTESTIELAIDTLGNLTSASSLATIGTITSGVWDAGSLTSSGALSVTATSTLATTTITDLIAKRIFTADTGTQTLTSSTTAISSSNGLLRISSDADYVMISTPTIASSSDGQWITLQNTGSFTIDLQDNTNLAGSAIFHGGTNGTLASGETMTLLFIEAVGGWVVQSHPNLQTIGGASEALQVRNTSGSSIPKGCPVYITGYNTGQNRILIGLADADDSNKMPSIGLTASAIANGANGQVITSGELDGIDTSGYSVNDSLYVSTTVGELTNVRPSVDDIQAVALVSRAHSNGILHVTGAGRTNDVPQIFTATKITMSNASSTNLTVSDNSWLGNLLTTGNTISAINDSGLALYNNASNGIFIDDGGYVGIGTTSPSVMLSVGATSTQQFLVNNLGVISDGVWQGTAVGTQWGGTGQNWVAAATGSLPYFSDTGVLTTLSPSTSGYFLKTQGAGEALIWAEVIQVWSESGNALYPTDISRNIGIGTTSPASLLEIYDTDASAQLTITVATSTDTFDPQIVFRTGASPVDKFVLGVDYSDSNKFKIATSSLATDAILTIDQSGNIGIGTTTPAYTLDVEGIVNATQFYQGGSLLISGYWTETGSDIYYNTGNVGIGTTTPATDLHILGSGTQFRIATTTSIYADFTVDASGYLTIDPTGGILSLNTSGIQNKLRVYSTSTDYIEMYHDGTNAIVSASTGNVEFGSVGSDVLIGDIGSAANLVFEESSSITGQGQNTISLGASGDTFNLNVSGVTYNYGGDFSIEETLTVTGTSTLATTTITGDLTVNTNQLYVDTATGNVGIGTASPTSTLDVLDTSNAQLTLTRDSSSYAQFKVDSAGDLRITASGGGSSGDDIKMIASNLWICSGTSIDSESCSSVTLSDTGNLVVKGDIHVEGTIKECADGYIRIPGNAYFGTSDFCVMKYEAKSCVNATVSTNCSAGTKSDGSGDPATNEFAASYPENKPWVTIPQDVVADDLDAQTACERIGTGYHLMTKEEAQTINRYVADNPQNWTSGEVGSGCMYGGHMDNAPAASLAATTDDMNGWYGTGENPTQAAVCPFSTAARGKEQRRTMYLPSGDVIWDWSGNVWEWLDETCTGGTGAGNWDIDAAWQEWNAADLDDYERNTLGPVSNTLISNPGGTGKYYGCTTNGNAFFRGGYWDNGVSAGVFTLGLSYAPSNVCGSIGFRCAR